MNDRFSPKHERHSQSVGDRTQKIVSGAYRGPA